MKNVFKTFLVLLFVLTTPLCAIFLSIALSGYSPSYIKTQLAKNDIYTTAVKQLHAVIDDATDKGDSEDPVVLVGPFVKKEITPVYIKGKVETFIDEMGDWTSGKRTTPPTISFGDLKEKLMKQNKSLIQDIEQAVAQYNDQKKQMDEEAKTNEQLGSEEAAPLPDIDIATVLKSDFQVPAGTYLGWIKTMAILSYFGTMITSISLVVLLFGILLLGENDPSRLRWVGMTLLMSFIWNVPMYGLWSFASVMMMKMLSENVLHVPVVYVPLVTSLLNPILQSYLRVGGLFVGIFFVMAIGSFVSSAMAPKPVVASKKEKK